MSKECPYCKMPVLDKAKKCPNCHEWVKPWAKGGHNWRTATVLIIISIPLAVSYYFSSQLSKTLTERTSDKPAGKIISSQEVATSCGGLSIIGELKIEQATEISGPIVEAIYYDKSNKLVDTASAYIRGTSDAGEVRPFKVTFDCKELKIDRSNYDHYKLSVH